MSAFASHHRRREIAPAYVMSVIGRERALLCLLLAATLATRVATSDRSLWLDETIAVLRAAGPLDSWFLANDAHPPLYFEVLSGWIELFGSSPLAVRSLSILWSLLAVVAIWGWSRTAFPQTSPLPATVLAALAPFSIWYGAEARNYAQLLALTALSGWIAWRGLDKGYSRKELAALAALLAAIPYTHYFGALYVASLAAVALTLLIARHELRARALATLGAVSVAALAFLPWLAWLAQHRIAEPPPSYAEPSLPAVFIAGLEMLIGFNSYALFAVLAACWPGLCLLALVVLPRTGAVSWQVGGLLALLALPVMLLILASEIGPRDVFAARFLSVCAPPMYLLVGRLWNGLAWSRARTIVAGAVVASLVVTALWQNVNPSNPKRFELRDAFAVVAQEAAPGDALVFVPQFASLQNDPVLNYYRLPDSVRVIDTMPRDRMRSAADAWSELSRLAPARIFLIDSSIGFSDDRSSRVRAQAHAYRQFIADRARRLAGVELPNVAVRVYAPDWRNR